MIIFKVYVNLSLPWVKPRSQMAPNHRALGVPLGHMAESSWKPQGEQRPDIRWVVGRDMYPWSYLILWKWILRYHSIYSIYHRFFTTPGFSPSRFYLFTTLLVFLPPAILQKADFPWVFQLWAQQLANSAVDAQHVFAEPARAYALQHLAIRAMARNFGGDSYTPMPPMRLFPPRRKRPPPAQKSRWRLP